jgi:hypothetical protein|tara:strand:- start:1343 stop:1663 length:321 start_codon:yes stop_codon:yes gene_type:complete
VLEFVNNTEFEEGEEQEQEDTTTPVELVVFVNEKEQFLTVSSSVALHDGVVYLRLALIPDAKRVISVFFNECSKYPFMNLTFSSNKPYLLKLSLTSSNPTAKHLIL